jgi:putative ABC transport system substrate-binding protein
MKRRHVLAAAWALATMRFPAFAQNQRAIPRVGILMIGSGNDSYALPALRDGLRSRGYVDGTTIEIDTQSLVDRFDRLDEAADRLVKQKMDVIVSYGATATRAAHKATVAIPIVMVSGTDPVRLGVAATLSKPGGNVTGVTFLHPEIDGKRLELLREVAPRIHRVGIVLNPASATEAQNFARWEVAAKKLGLEVQPVEIRVQGDIDRVIADVVQGKVDALAVVGGTMFVANRRQLVAAIAKTPLPAIYGSSDFPEAGGLISYGPNIWDGFRQAAGHVDKILKGAKPGDLPIEQATKFELAVNLRAAKALGIAIPQSILIRADKVIE